MKMKKMLSLLLVLALCLGGMSLLSGCGDDSNKVVIYSSDEDYINEYFLERLKAEFPDYKITIEYLSTGKNAAKLQNEGKNTPCDIVWGLEVGYLDNMTGLLADISDYSDDHYVEDMQMGDGKYLVAHRYSGCETETPV
jgi:iron(III) transport system substrate-binding protein